MNRLWRHVFLWLTVCAAAAPVRAAALRTVLERDSIMAGEATTLRLVVENGDPKSIQSFPTVSGLTIQFAQKGQEISVVNGQRTFRHNLDFLVTASQPGQYAIPVIQVIVDGQSHSSEAIKLNVIENDLHTLTNRYAFVKLVVPKRELYVGELMPVEILLYVAGQGQNLQMPQLKGDGFVINKRADHRQFNTQINNVPYSGMSFKMTISAAKAGQLALGPAEMSFTMLVRPQQQANQRDLFAEFFGPRYQQHPVTLSSRTQPLNVLPLPVQNRPMGFSGAIGQFNWTVAANPATLNAGDPITLKIVVTGQGNLDSIKLPDWNWPGFKTYAANSSIETTDPLGLRGVKTFEQVIVPEKPAISEIPALQFAFFDPNEKAYRTLAHPPTPITVRGSAGPQVQSATANAGAGVEEEEEARKDIVHIKAHHGTLLAVGPPLVREPWFLALQVIPVGAFMAALLWRKRQDQLANNPRLRRKLEVRRVVEHGLRELHEHAHAGRAEEFYAAVFRLLQEQLGERLDLPSFAITEAVLDEHLPARGASPELIAQLHELFRICNQARYAPTGAAADLLAFLAQVQTALRELQQLPD